MPPNYQNNYTFIIVGGGIAGVSCVESLQVWAPSEPVLLISSSSCVKSTVNAIQLTKTLVQFDVEEINASDIESRHSSLDVLIDEVVTVDTNRREVETAGGRQFKYSELCLCMGGQPKLIAKNMPNVVGIRDMDSVVRLREILSGARRMVIVGNGGIASELVYEVKNVEKIWVIKDQHISSAFVDPGAAEFLHHNIVKADSSTEEPVRRLRYTADRTSEAALGPEWHANFELRGNQTDESVKIEFGTTVERVEEVQGQYPIKVALANGSEYYADVLVSATGVEPRMDRIVITPTPLELAEDGGIVVDEYLSTSAPHVFAAGDVVTAGWKLAPHWHQMRLWTQARQMGQYAAKTMAGRFQGEVVHQDFCFELFSHVTRFFGFKVILLGLFNGQRLNGQYDVLLRVTKGKEFVKLVLQDGKIQGALLIGETDLEEMCENLILDQLDVSDLGEDLLNPDVDIDDYFD